MKYPPFCRLINIVLRAAKKPAAQKAAEDLRAKLSAQFRCRRDRPRTGAVQPVCQNQFRYQVLVKGADESFDACLRFLRGYRPAKAFMSVDVDPSDLL